MKTDPKILICYNSPASVFSVYNGKPSDNGNHLNDLSEVGLSKQIGKIKKNLQQYFPVVESFAIDRNINRIINKLNSSSPGIIFNFVESVEGISNYEYCSAGLFELMGFHYTGNTPSCLGNCLDKERTKNILRSFNIDTPDSVVIKKSDKISEKDFKLKFPVILKLLTEDASIGISEYSVVYNLHDLVKHVGFLSSTYSQSILAEEYIDGRELNVAILGDRVLPVSEILFNGLPDGLPKIVTYDGKWIEESIYYENTVPMCPAQLDLKIKKDIEAVALAAFEALSCRDYARVDVRLDKNNKPFVIEVNPNPDISEDSGFARAVTAAGLSYTDLLCMIANFALERYRNDTKTKVS
jgi:D-alanine-D-alanine ligase